MIDSIDSDIRIITHQPFMLVDDPRNMMIIDGWHFVLATTDDGSNNHNNNIQQSLSSLIYGYDHYIQHWYDCNDIIKYHYYYIFHYNHIHIYIYHCIIISISHYIQQWVVIIKTISWLTHHHRAQEGMSSLSLVARQLDAHRVRSVSWVTRMPWLDALHASPCDQQATSAWGPSNGHHFLCILR